MRKTDVVIIGAGPAGAVCGYLLQKAGIGCVVIDRASFPREKICGGGLTPKSWTLLNELIPGFTYTYNGVRKIRLSIESKHFCEFEAAEELRIVKRKEFDKQLLDAYIAAGGAFQKDSFLRYEERDGEVIVTLKSGEEIACRYLVGADGANSKVRHQLKGHRDKGLLIMEEYVEKAPENVIEVDLSRQYDYRGYYYRFPNEEFDVVGYGDSCTTAERFRQLLRERGISETRLMGCYVYMENDYPMNDHIILIGDAGGFANRLTCEGIKGAFITARNAAEAIKNNRPFREVNAPLFKKVRSVERFCRVFYHPLTIWVLGQMCRWPGWLKWYFDKGVRG